MFVPPVWKLHDHYCHTPQLCLTIKLFFFSLITIFFSIFFFLIFAIWKPFTLALKKWDWTSIKKNPFKFIKPQHGSFFTLTKIKLDHVIFQLQFKNNWLMWLWFLLWFFFKYIPYKMISILLCESKSLLRYFRGFSFKDINNGVNVIWGSFW